MILAPRPAVYVTPDGAPQACSVDGNHGAAVLELEHGNLCSSGGVGAALDVVILALEDLGTVHLNAFQFPEHVAFRVNHKGFFNLIGILGQLVLVGELVQFRLGAVLGTGEHLGDGLRLLICILTFLEGLGYKSEERCYNHHNEGGVDYSIYIVIGIHSAVPLGG